MPVLILGTAIALVVSFNPRAIGAAVAGADRLLIGQAVLAVLAFLLVQGLRWHQLLRAVGIRLRVFHTLLLNVAGQAITAIVPLGDLTRAIFASEASGGEVGRTAATVTVQELGYTLLLAAATAPALLALHYGVWLVAATAAGIAGVVVVLTVPTAFRAVCDLMGEVPFLRPLLPQVERLRGQTVGLLRRPDTLAWTVLDALRVALAVTSLWLIVEALRPGVLGWWQAAFVLGLSSLSGALSLIPGGAGASEAGMIGLLVLLGVDPTVATAAALLQRLLTTGLPTVVGWAAYVAVARRFPLRSPLSPRARWPGAGPVSTAV